MEKKERKPGGWSVMTEEQRAAAKEKARRTRELKRQILTSPGAEEIRDALEDPNRTHSTLEKMRYSKDPREAAIYSANPDLSPLHVPNDIQEKYPEFTFKWCSTKKIDRRGGTGPWEIFKDKQFSKDGKIRRADDTILAVMPKELHHDTIAKPKAERAEAALRGLEDSRLEEMEKRAASARQSGDQYAEVLHNVNIQGRSGATGIQVGRHQLARRSERLRDQFQQKVQTNRKYFDMGR